MPLLVDWTWKSTVLLTAVWLVAACLRRQTAALRHRVWALALAGLAVAPVLSLVLPAWRSRIIPAATTQAVTANPPRAISSTAASNRIPVRRPPWVTIVWSLGCGAGLLRLFAGVFWIRWRTLPLPGPLSKAFAHALPATFRVHRSVRLLAYRQDRDLMPVTFGWLYPCIALPTAAAHWTNVRRRAVLCHELAHIARCDWAWQICAEIARAFYWFHPLFWLAVRNLRRESEIACDDVVLNAGISAPDYASELLSLSRAQQSSGWLCSPALAMAYTSDLERRFTSMLNPLLNRRRLSRKAKLITAIAFAGALLPLAALRAPAQGQAGKLTGTVYDPDGAVIPNANVTLVNAQANYRTTATANLAGKYSFVGFPAGVYEIRVAQPGFRLYANPSVMLNSGQGAALDVNLALGQVTEKVDVVASGPRAANALPAAAPLRLRVGGNVQATKLLRQIKPAYPEAARAAGIEGAVVFEAQIGVDGRLTALRILNSVAPALDQAAMEAVQQWQYQPALLNGEPAEVTTNITVNFKLP